MEQPQIRPTLTLTLERVALGFSLLLFRIIMQPFTLRVIESAFGVDVGKQRPVHRLLYEETARRDALAHGLHVPLVRTATRDHDWTRCIVHPTSWIKSGSDGDGR